MIYQFDDYSIDTANFELRRAGNKIECEPKVFDLIVYLVSHHERLVSRDELFESIWEGREVSDTSLSNHIKTARKVLGDNGQAQQVIKTTPRRGYQFIAELQENGSLSSVRKKHPTNFRYLVVIVLLIITLVSLLLKDLIFNNELNTGRQKNYLIAVLPFLNTKPSVDSDFLGFAMADRVISELAYIKSINVRPSTSVRKYVDTSFDLKRIGEELNVDYLLTGNYLSNDNKIRLNIELMEIKSQKLIWRSKQIEVVNDNAFELQDIVAQRVLEGLKLKLPSGLRTKNPNKFPSNPIAFDLYLRSIAQPFSTDGHIKAIELLKESILLDDQYAPTYVQLGNRIRRLEQFGLVNTGESHDTISYYQKALSLDDELLSALSHLAFIYTETNRIEQAMELASRMLKINSSNAQTRFTLGYIFRYAGLAQEAINEMEVALSLDPKNLRFRSLVATYSAMGQFEAAQSLVESYPESSFTIGWKGILNLRLGNSDLALKYFDTIITTDANGLWGLVATIHKSHITSDLEHGLVAVHQLEQTNIADSETVFYTAVYYCMLGDNKRCIQSLKKAVNGGYYNYPFMEKSPYFNDIRNHAEFSAIYLQAKNKSVEFRGKYLKLLSYDS